MQTIPNRRWILERAFLYFVFGLVIVGCLAIKDQPGENPGLFTMDEIRPWIAGGPLLAAFSAWNWVSGTPRQTWEYTRFWAMTFMLTELAGLGILVLLKILSADQGTIVLVGMTVGCFIGVIRVGSALAKNEPIEF